MTTRDSGGQAQTGRNREETDEAQTDEAPAPEANPEVAERQEKLTEDVDSMLDEIDSVLEENAEEFVRGYVQKGGQ
jgi:prokaryotic ubiquitin-like protein Pup